jgi:hypothetical protein
MSVVTTAGPAATWRRRACLLGLALLALVVLVIALTLFQRWKERRDWREACAEADRLDPGWRWEDLEAKSVVLEEENSTVHVLAAAKLLPQGTRDHLKRVERAIQGKSPQNRLSPQVLTSLREALAASGPALAEARRLADCPSGRVPPHTSPLILNAGLDLRPFFDVSKNLLNPQLILQADSGNSAAALVAVRAMIYTSRPPANSNVFFGALIAGAAREYAVRGVEHVLAQGEPAPAALEATAQLLEEELNRPLLLAAFRGSRAEIEDDIRAMDEGLVSRAKLAESARFSNRRVWVSWAPVDRALNYLTGADFRLSNAAAELRYLTWVIERLKESPDGLRTRAAEWAAMRERLPGQTATVDAYARCVSDLSIMEARLRCAAAAIAAERFRRANGRWPTTLDELVPRYLSAVPHDPFDIKPLKLARRPDGIVIYSVGPDGKDDGGNLGGGQDRDLGLRLWDVKHRRQPPRARILY